MSTGVKLWLKNNRDNLFFTGILIGSVCLFLLAYLFQFVFVTVGSGEGGVLYRRFLGGTDMTTVYGEGTHVIFPLNVMHVYDTRVQERRITTSVLSSDGLTIILEVSVRFYLEYEQLPKLHKKVGPEYEDKIVNPVTISSVREIIGQYRPEELYKSRIDEFQNDMLIEAVEQNSDMPIVFVDIIIRNIRLPDLINTAIETKLRYEQQFLQYQFLLEKERQELKRLEIEATGISRFQEIVTSTLSDRYLKWKGIQATLKLASSTNSKVIIVGNDGKSLPIILSAENDQQPQTKTVPDAKKNDNNTDSPTVPAKVVPLPKPDNTKKAASGN
ncbi:MAG: prohibitin family protein [SAR324 cluster bacterium]|nr:prohibitin family protein [SAR324 cluster bacterium]